MNYKVIIREIEYVNRVVYVEAESAEVAAGQPGLTIKSVTTPL